jgi:hypothetical protein
MPVNSKTTINYNNFDILVACQNCNKNYALNIIRVSDKKIGSR